MSVIKFDKWKFTDGSTPNALVNIQHSDWINYSGDRYDSFDGMYMLPHKMKYTPKAVGNVLLIRSTDQHRSMVGMGMQYGLRINGRAVTENSYDMQDFFYKGEATNHHLDLMAQVWVNVSGLQELEIQPVMFTWSGSGELSYSYGQHCITVMEFQGS